MMGYTEDANRRKLVKRLLQLWNMIPDNKLSEVFANVFELDINALPLRTDEEVYSRINDLITGKVEMIYMTRLHKNPPINADNIAAWRDFTADDYARAHKFLDEMKLYVGKLTKQEYATIKGQALHGDVEGARRGLRNVIERKMNVR